MICYKTRVANKKIKLSALPLFKKRSNIFNTHNNYNKFGGSVTLISQYIQSIFRCVWTYFPLPIFQVPILFILKKKSLFENLNCNFNSLLYFKAWHKNSCFIIQNLLVHSNCSYELPKLLFSIQFMKNITTDGIL